ncbi:MAG: heavy metal-associated domain-containing protein [Flavobacteriaceae bacterium]|nr:MAG: heavy metal-associated domain-containing protein [Flavobacteriaceae bacterium]
MKEFIEKYLITLWGLTQEMAPWLLFGFFFAGILRAFFSQKLIQKQVGKPGLKSILKAVFLGIPLPLCSCGVIPAGISFYQNGASKSATNAFLISTPQTGVDSIFATYALMGWPFAILRPFIALITGVFGGLFSLKFDPETKKETKNLVSNPKEESLSWGEKWKIVFRYGFLEMVEDIAKWLLIGLCLASLIELLIPSDFFTQYLGNIWLELLVVLAISVPMYVCATGSIPIALTLLLKGISPGAAIVFLMAGPATNVATISVIQNVLGKKALYSYLFSIIFGGIFFGVLINLFVPKEFFINALPITTKNTSEHHHKDFLNLFFGLILVALIIRALIPKSKTQNKVAMEKNTLTLYVEGMTCNHCKNNVENGLQKLENIQSAEVDLDQKLVTIKGSASMDQIKSTIQNLGYTPKD